LKTLFAKLMFNLTLFLISSGKTGSIKNNREFLHTIPKKYLIHTKNPP
jgi:hypothetical protein